MFFDIDAVAKGRKPSFGKFVIDDKNILGKTRKKRQIFNPNEAMRQIHGRMVEWISSLWINMPSVAACLPGCSAFENAKRHRGSRYFYLTDIHDAYPSVSGKRLSEVLCTLSSELFGQEEKVYSLLQKFFLQGQNGLITGAPASPALFNLYGHFFLDLPLKQKYPELTYSRYLDDLTFSSQTPIGKKKRKAIRKIIADAGFMVSHRKSRVYDLRVAPIMINGIGLEINGRMFLPRHYARKVAGLIHKTFTNPQLMSKVHGMFGTFNAATPSWPKNRLEKRIIYRYRRLCEKWIRFVRWT